MQKKMAKPKPRPLPEIETLPDAWERFERAVDVVVKEKPKHRKHAVATGSAKRRAKTK